MKRKNGFARRGFLTATSSIVLASSLRGQEAKDAANYRMSEPQAAVAAAQLGRLEGIAAKRARLGRLGYDSLYARRYAPG